MEHGLFQWFTGGHHSYMKLSECMMNDWLWITITVVLDITIAAGYALIAIHWWQNQKHLPPKAPARVALGNMRNIFVFCGICGYAFIPIKMVWPAWRLYDFFLVILAYFTWRYAWSAKDLKVVYRELGRSKKLQDELDKSREESRHKSFFLNALSHDLRTPLNGLMLQANLAELSMRGGDSESVAGALQQIKTATRATSDLLDGLLEYAKADWLDSGNNLQEFPLDELVRGVIERNRAVAVEKKLSLRSLHSNLCVQSDRMKLERILTNLVNNAIKFTESGSVEISSRQTSAGVEICVIDSGVGIEEQVREQLFEEFFQVHNHERDPRKGFGLGLAIAKRLVTQLGGEIRVDGAVGSGSRFTIVLPGIIAGGEREHQAESSRLVGAAS